MCSGPLYRPILEIGLAVAVAVEGDGPRRMVRRGEPSVDRGEIGGSLGEGQGALDDDQAAGILCGRVADLIDERAARK